MSVKLFIAISSNRDHKPYFTQCLINLVTYLTTKGIVGSKLEALSTVIQSDTSVLSYGRQSMIDRAIKEGFTHILFLDDDMVFADNMVDHLMSHDLNVVAVNGCKKNPLELNYCALGLDGKYIESRDKTDVVEASKVGLAVMLLNLNALKDIPKPYFEVLWNEETQSYQDQDYYFCKKLREHGIKLWIDNNVSNATGHVGDYIYRFHSYP